MSLFRQPPVTKAEESETRIITNAELKRGDILLKYNDGTMINKIIVKGTKVNARLYKEEGINIHITHAAICIEDGKLIAEASAQGLRIRDITTNDHYTWEVFRYLQVPVTDLAADLAFSFTKECIEDTRTQAPQKSGQYALYSAVQAVFKRNPERIPAQRKTEVTRIIETFGLVTEQYYCSHFVSFVYILAAQIITGNLETAPIDRDYKVILPANLYKYLQADPNWQHVGYLDNVARIMADVHPQILPGSGALSLVAMEQAQLATRRVVVRIWVSAGNPHVHGENVGHISIETPNRYISLWPRQATALLAAAKDVDGTGVFKPISHEFFTDYHQDLRYEQRSPGITYCFYTLNYLEMERVFDDLKNTLRGWALLGGILCRDAASCASAAYRVLQAGGIERLEPSKARQGLALTGESSGALWYKKSHSVASSSHIIVSSSCLLITNTEMAENYLKISKADFDRSVAAGFYCVEMGLGGILDSPDKLALTLKEAKRKETIENPRIKEIQFPRYSFNLMSFSGEKTIPMIEEYFRMYPSKYDVITLIKCENKYYVWSNFSPARPSQLIEIDLSKHPKLANKFPAPESKTCVILEEALDKQLISQAAYIEITGKGEYLFTETQITEEARSGCAHQ